MFLGNRQKLKIVLLVSTVNSSGLGTLLGVLLSQFKWVDTRL